MKRHPPNALREQRLTVEPPLSQAELASRVGCARKEISDYEVGLTLPTFVKALRLTRVLGRPVEDLFWGLTDAVDAWIGEQARATAAAVAPGASSEAPVVTDTSSPTPPESAPFPSPSSPVICASSPPVSTELTLVPSKAVVAPIPVLDAPS